MTYNYKIVISSINLYKQLEKNKINGKKREQIIINTFDIAISTFYNWYFLYTNLSFKDFQLHFNNSNKREPKITKEHILKIIEIVKNNTFIRARGIKNKLLNTFKIKISETSIRTILLKNGITFKKSYKQIMPYTETELKNKKDILKQQINKAKVKNIKSIDEFGIHFNEQPNYAWSEKGKQFCIPTKNKNIYGKKYSLCMSIDTSKQISYILKEGSINKDDFNDFVVNDIPITKKTALLMDNARTHHSKLFKNSIKDKKINVIYGIPYHSKYNQSD